MKNWFIILWLSTSLLLAQKEDDVPALQRRLTITFQDADILSVLRLLSLQNNLNLVTNRDVRGKVTVHFNDVTLEEALETILHANGYDYFIEKDIIYVKPSTHERSSTLRTRVFSLNYSDAFDLKETMLPFLSPKGKIEAVSHINDGTTQEKRSNILIISDLDHHLTELDSIIQKLDVPIPQILIEVRMFEITVGGDQNAGIGWPTAITGRTSDARNPDDPGVPTNFAMMIPLEDKLHNLVMGKLSIDKLAFSLNFLKTETHSKLISNPKILTLNNQRALISVGTTVPVQTISRSASGDIISFTDKNVSIQLVVTPRLHADSTITLLIEPLIEDIIGYAGPDDNRQPIISKREAKTQVVVGHNESVAIGGLLKELEVDTKEKVWLLGDIWLIGKLFTRSIKEKRKTDLLIFITPHVLSMKGS